MQPWMKSALVDDHKWWLYYYELQDMNLDIRDMYPDQWLFARLTESMAMPDLPLWLGRECEQLLKEKEKKDKQRGRSKQDDLDLKPVPARANQRLHLQLKDVEPPAVAKLPGNVGSGGGSEPSEPESEPEHDSDSSHPSEEQEEG